MYHRFLWPSNISNVNKEQESTPNAKEEDEDDAEHANDLQYQDDDLAWPEQETDSQYIGTTCDVEGEHVGRLSEGAIAEEGRGTGELEEVVVDAIPQNTKDDEKDVGQMVTDDSNKPAEPIIHLGAENSAQVPLIMTNSESVKDSMSTSCITGEIDLGNTVQSMRK
ncbi:hypothetical protein L208DRAFT_1383072 [Tricholoma matsutake]|nr:hypothetical protein L208DRAFT_1383072 [Tricholoma matsutake 945]